MGDLLSGLLLLAIVGGFVEMVLRRSERNTERQNEEYDKLVKEYEKVIHLNTEEEIINQ